MAFNVSYIYQAIDKFSATANKIARSANNIAEKTKKASLNIQKLGRGIRDTGVKMTAFATLPLALLARGMIKAASDAQEVQSQFEFVFSKVAEGAAKSAAELAKNYNFSKREAKELSAGIGDFTQNLGFSQEKSLEMSTALNKLAADVASFKNASGGAKQVSLAFQSALVGEREALKTLKVAILQTDVDAKRKAMAATGKLTGMTLKQANALATIDLLFQNFSSSIGDVARTQESHANKLRRLNATYDDLSVTIGKKLLPLHVKLMEIALKLIGRFNNLSPKVQKIILVSAGLVAALGPLLLILGGLVVGLGLVMSPMGAVVVGIAAIAAAAIKFKPIGDAFRIFFHLTRLKVELLINAFKTMGKAIADFIPDFGFIDKIASKLGGLGNGFSLGGFADFLSNQSMDVNYKGGGVAVEQGNSKTTLEGNINVNAPQGAVSSVDLSTKGSKTNLGMSMVGAI